VSVGIEPEGMAVSPDSKDPGVVSSENNQHGPFHRHRKPAQIVGNLLVGSRPRFFRIQG